MTEETKAAFKTGIAGWHDDDLAFDAGWGFDVAAIAITDLASIAGPR